MRRRERPEGRPRQTPTATAKIKYQGTSSSPVVSYLLSRDDGIDGILARLEALEEAVYGPPQPFDWPQRCLTYEETYGDEAAS